jgi:hypothetical protein
MGRNGAGTYNFEWFSFAMILTFFVPNVCDIVSYDRKELLNIRTAITNLDL